MNRKEIIKDLFSHGEIYLNSRPRYPNAVGSALFALCGQRNSVVWDVGAGNGQLTKILANHFEFVVGSDINENQISKAMDSPNVRYAVISAEESAEEIEARNIGLKRNCVDLITVAQALHWFDFPKFHQTVKEMLNPNGGIYAAVGYDLPKISPNVDQLVMNYYDNVIGKYWETNRRHVETHYKNIPFPEFEKDEELDVEKLFPPEALCISLEWKFEDLIAYLNSWSATQSAIKQTGKHPLKDSPKLVEDMHDAWNLNGNSYNVKFPLFFKVFKMKN
jgi:2-polyprenyl-3-methyl-5-hydroxy-6-metoxy-1,4-benzoquinol methylase